MGSIFQKIKGFYNCICSVSCIVCMQAAFVDNTPDGRVRVLRRLRKGQLFGDVGTLLHTTYHASVRASSHIELLTISWLDLLGVIRQYPEVQKKVHHYALYEHGVDIPVLQSDETK